MYSGNQWKSRTVKVGKHVFEQKQIPVEGSRCVLGGHTGVRCKGRSKGGREDILDEFAVTRIVESARGEKRLQPTCFVTLVHMTSEDRIHRKSSNVISKLDLHIVEKPKNQGTVFISWLK